VDQKVSLSKSFGNDCNDERNIQRKQQITKC
jgi:hypothetical protein